MTLYGRSCGALLAVLGLGLIVSGCQSLPASEKSAAGAAIDVSNERNSTLRELTRFQFTGGLGIWTESESVPARIRWIQSDGDLDLQLSGPLGVGQLQLQDKSGFVSLLRGETVVITGTSADNVVQRGLGLTAPVPIEELKQWVRGLAGTGSSTLRDSEGKLTSLRYVDESGVRWSVSFKRYQTVDRLSLPSLITASGGGYFVRLTLKNWKLTTIITQTGSNEPSRRLSIPGR